MAEMAPSLCRKYIFVMASKQSKTHTLFLRFRPGNEKGSKSAQEQSRFQCTQRAYLIIIKRNISKTITAAFGSCNLKANRSRAAPSSSSQGKQHSSIWISCEAQGYARTPVKIGHLWNLVIAVNKSCCLTLWPQTSGAGLGKGYVPGVKAQC